MPHVKVVKKGPCTSWESRRFVSPDPYSHEEEYDVVHTIPAEWRTVPPSPFHKKVI
jgi:hypothetical protein